MDTKFCYFFPHFGKVQVFNITHLRIREEQLSRLQVKVFFLFCTSRSRRVPVLGLNEGASAYVRYKRNEVLASQSSPLWHRVCLRGDTIRCRAYKKGSPVSSRCETRSPLKPIIFRTCGHLLKLITFKSIGLLHSMCSVGIRNEEIINGHHLFRCWPLSFFVVVALGLGFFALCANFDWLGTPRPACIPI